MTEDDARAWLVDRLNVSRGTIDRIERFLDLLRAEAVHQNLIAASTLDSMWSRHVVDSAQLISLVDRPQGHWLDLGSGAGFPGIVIALITDAPVSMVESRRRRVEFLRSVADALALDHVDIHLSRLETVQTFRADVITARAFAPLPRLLDGAHRFATKNTQWVLPKGRNVDAELDAVAGTWQMVFHVERSVTDDESGIIVARDVRRRTG